MQSIYLSLCSKANDKGISYPSRRGLSKTAGCGLGSVDKYLKQLEDEGFIKKTHQIKDGTKEFTSNLYQILVQPDTENNATPGIENDTETITNINYTNLTIKSDVPSDEKSLDLDKPNQEEVDPIGLLPLRYGTTSILRLANIYKGLWLAKMKTPKKEFNYPRFGKAINSLLKNHSEIQITALMDSFFDWQGTGGDNPRDNVFLQGGSFRIEGLVSISDSVTAFIKNNLNIDYDNPEKIREFVKKQLIKKDIT